MQRQFQMKVGRDAYKKKSTEKPVCFQETHN